MSQRYYDINFNKLIVWLLPSSLRKIRLVAFLRIAVTPFVFVYQNFLRYRKEKLYDLMITSQVCYLELMLNDKYDYTDRRIFIDDGVEQVALYLYQDEEDHDIFLFTDAENTPQIFYTDGEIVGESFDFIINVPASISFSELEMISMVKRKRLPGMKFKIQTF